jgi:hypothetical protein
MPLQLMACNSSAANQQFGVLHELNSTSVATIIAGTKLCLDIEGFKKESGSAVYAWPCGADGSVPSVPWILPSTLDSVIRLAMWSRRFGAHLLL